MKRWFALLCLITFQAQSSEYFFSLTSEDKLKITLLDKRLSLFEAITIQHNQLVISNGVEINLSSASEACISAEHDSEHLITHLSNALAQWLREQPSSEEPFEFSGDMVTHSWQGSAIFPLPPTNGLPIATWSNSLSLCSGATAINDGKQCIFANCNERFSKKSQARADHHHQHLKNIILPCQCPVEGCGKLLDGYKSCLQHIGRLHFKKIDPAQFQ